MKHLLCATDLLPKSEAAIDRAGLLADERGAKLSLLHVVSPMASGQVPEQTLQNAIGRLKLRAQVPAWRGEVTPAPLVRMGKPGQLVLAAAGELKSDLLILGPHRSRGVRDVFEGTIAEKILTARQCPLLIARQEARGPYQNVLLALDLSVASALAVRAAESLVLSEGANAKIVHAYESAAHEMLLPYGGIGARGGPRHAALSWKRMAYVAIRDVLKFQSANFTRYHVLIENGAPASVIVRAMKAFAPDLLVMGTRGGGRLHRALLGSVANAVLNRASCDVLVVPESAASSYQSIPRDVRRTMGGRPLEDFH
jgi:nucleotide-binding universal stress UspA family protein